MTAWYVQTVLVNFIDDANVLQPATVWKDRQHPDRSAYINIREKTKTKQ